MNKIRNILEKVVNYFFHFDLKIKKLEKRVFELEASNKKFDEEKKSYQDQIGNFISFMDRKFNTEVRDATAAGSCPSLDEVMKLKPKKVSFGSVDLRSRDTLLRDMVCIYHGGSPISYTGVTIIHTLAPK
jgi:hypothetical protein